MGDIHILGWILAGILLAIIVFTPDKLIVVVEWIKKLFCHNQD